VTDARASAELAAVAADIVACRACPRLVRWRERVAREKVARYRTQAYWGRPVPGFGERDARILVVGLAPAAHGGNRTGRVFTGDPSGDFLYPSMFRAGLSDRPTSTHARDGLRLNATYVAAVNRCAPPGNAPTTVERDRCLPYLEREISALAHLLVIVPLGEYAWNGVLRALSALGHVVRPKPRFGHGAETVVGPYTIVGSYHPSHRNTATRTLTPDMLDAVFRRAAELAAVSPSRIRRPSRPRREPPGDRVPRLRPARGSAAGGAAGRARG
jgi:uracil-DNA glycosylase family 4